MNSHQLKKKKLVSIVIPVYNEQENIPLLYKTLCELFQTLDQHYNFELIFVDDGSKDNSWNLLAQLAETDTRIKAFSFSRNFGHQIALQAGYDNATGDAIISMDADMQHPPEMIPQLLQKWQEGFPVVYVRKKNRKDGFFKRIFASLFYKFINTISETKMPRHVSDFRLIDKKVLLTLRQCKDRNPFWRGLVPWTGFSHAFLECDYFERHAGVPGYTWRKSISLAWDGITSFSKFPLQISAYVGFISVFLASLLGFYMIGAVLFFGVSFGLGVWLAEILFFLIGGQFLSLWLLGEYIARIVEQQKGRPLYLVDSTLPVSCRQHGNRATKGFAIRGSEKNKEIQL